MIGVFGGTFDPIHNAHIQLALEVQKILHLDHVRMIPCRTPAHRASPQLSPALRFNLLQNAIKDYPVLVADDRELQRNGPSYMIDTLASLKSEFDQTLCLIMGIDAYNKLDGWKQWRRLFDMAHIIVMRRPGDEQISPPSEQLAEVTRTRVTGDIHELESAACGKVIFVANTKLDISSSDIRDKLAVGQSVAALLPESVNKEITARALYTDRKREKDLYENDEHKRYQ